MMKKIRQRFWYWYFCRKVNALNRAVAMMFRHGTVRELRWLAGKFKEIGKQVDCEDYVALGERLDAEAERVVLRRIGF